LKPFWTAAIAALSLTLLFAFALNGCEGKRDSANAPTESTAQVSVSLEKQDARIQQLAAIQARNEDRFLQIAGARGIGIGLDGENYVFHVFLNTSAGRRDAVPAAIEGVRVQVIETDDFVARSTLTAIFPLPVPAGVSTGNKQGCFAGTRGFLMYKGTQVGYITNNHVAVAGGKFLCINSAPIGTPEIQPGTYDAVPQCSITYSTTIGTLDSYVTIKGGNNLVDAAFVSSNTSTISSVINVLGTPTKNAQDPAINMIVKKSGRTTEVTTGTISTINATVMINYGAGCGNYKFVGQFVVTPGSFSAAGDSGSPVVDANNNPVGLLFAGSSSSTICNPIKTVMSQLGVSF
jgi:hypothetical protein